VHDDADRAAEERDQPVDEVAARGLGGAPDLAHLPDEPHGGAHAVKTEDRLSHRSNGLTRCLR